MLGLDLAPTHKAADILIGLLPGRKTKSIQTQQIIRSSSFAAPAGRQRECMGRCMHAQRTRSSCRYRSRHVHDRTQSRRKVKLCLRTMYLQKIRRLQLSTILLLVHVLLHASPKHVSPKLAA